MRKMLTRLTLAALTVTLSGSLLAQDKKLKSPAKPSTTGAAPGMAAQAPKPDPELGQLKYFVGTWTCKGTDPSTALGPEHPTQATVKIVSEYGGFWITARYEETKTAENPMPYRFLVIWGHDAKDKKFYQWSFDGMGGNGRAESSGWDGDKLVFNGSMMLMGKPTSARDNFTKKSDTELVHMGEMELDGKWTKTDEETCTKGAAPAPKPEKPAAKKS
jgi:uncharacterized protein DUF1579